MILKKGAKTSILICLYNERILAKFCFERNRIAYLLKMTIYKHRALKDVMHRIEITILGVNLIYRKIKVLTNVIDRKHVFYYNFLIVFEHCNFIPLKMKVKLNVRRSHETVSNKIFIQLCCICR